MMEIGLRPQLATRSYSIEEGGQGHVTEAPERTRH